MPDPTTSSLASRSIQRRSLVKGVAWATPAIATAAAAPLAAASTIPERGLNGWVSVGRQCNTWGPDFYLDGRGTYPDRGLWVFTTQEDQPQEATITFWLPSESFTFTNNSQAGWSNLTRNSGLDSQSPAAGYYAYTTTYTGTWTYRNPSGTQNDRWEAASDPYFSASSIPGGCGEVCAYATRTVIYSATDRVSFTRGPVCV